MQAAVSNAQRKRIAFGMDQTSDLQELTQLLSQVNYSSQHGQDGFNFSRATAFTLVQDYISNMYTMSEPTTVALLCLYLPLFILSLSGNSLVIYVVYRNKHMRRLKNLFLVNLSIADLFVTLVCMPLTAGNIVFRLWVYGEIMCKLVGYIQGVAVICSIFTLAALSIDRYLAIMNSSRGTCSTCVSPWIILGATWLPASICVFPLLCVRSVYAMTIPEFEIHFSYCIEEWPHYMDRKAYSIVLLILTYIIPLIIIIGCYSLIGKKLCSVEFHRKTSTSSSTIMLGRKRVARMLIALILVFITCWLPYNVTSLSLDLNYRYLDARVLPYTLLLAHAHSAVNPLLYWFLNKSFRHCIRRALRCSSNKRRRRATASPNGQARVHSPWQVIFHPTSDRQPNGHLGRTRQNSSAPATQSHSQNRSGNSSSNSMLRQHQAHFNVFHTFPLDHSSSAESIRMMVHHHNDSNLVTS